LRNIVRALPVLTLALAGCAAPNQADIGNAQRHYLAAKAECVAEYPDSLVEQSDCRSRAANAYIRPYYRYGDLMTRAQDERRIWAAKVDRHEMTRKAFDRAIARSERETAREEDRRNAMAHTASSYETTPLTPVFAGISRLFQ
jgi:hypothetical protein